MRRPTAPSFPLPLTNEIIRDRTIPPGFPGLHLDIRDAGLELFGSQLASPMAHLLGVNPRTVQRWANGQNDPPAPILDRVSELLAIARRSRADAAADRAMQARERTTG